VVFLDGDLRSQQVAANDVCHSNILVYWVTQALLTSLGAQDGPMQSPCTLTESRDLKPEVQNGIPRRYCTLHVREMSGHRPLAYRIGYVVLYMHAMACQSLTDSVSQRDLSKGDVNFAATVVAYMHI
jgi:hypothetical protein